MNEELLTKKLYPIRGKLSVKILAGILLVAMCIIAVGSLFGIFILADSGAYDYNYREADFYNSVLCRILTESIYYRNLSSLLFMDAGQVEAFLKDEANWYQSDSSNVLFVLNFYTRENFDNEKAPYDTVQNVNDEQVHSEPVYHSAYFYYNEKNSRESYVSEIKLYLRKPLLENGEGFVKSDAMFSVLSKNTTNVIIWTIISTLTAIALFIFLLCSAGRKKDSEEIHLNWFDRIPLDLLLLISSAAVGLLLFFAIELSYMGYYYWIWMVALTSISILLSGAIILSFCMTLAGRIKAGGFLKNTLINRWLLRFVLYMLKGIKRRSLSFLRMLPMTWRTAVIICGAGLVNIMLMYFLIWNGSVISLFLLVLFDLMLFVLAIWLAYQMQVLKKGGEELSKGNLNYKTDTTKMFWDFKNHGENLNSISEGMSLAVDERMKSEQFKTELITNVSHDIKTPLTSIINYVDLLKKGDADNGKTAEYIEVLERQSGRLKKLTEDLVEASKASSGILVVSKSRNDVCELLRQALGEYEERLADAGISVIIGEPERKVDIICDGRLMWRVFDNLLSNICKYSQQGTRAFVDIEKDENRVWMIFKNTSRDVLNISADELMERFVRGDRSRSTEGSGLGLSIARSLIELQGGTFSMYLDGDLFKVIMTLPCTEGN